MRSSHENTHFLLRRVHSLLGLLPVGGFLCFHMWENSQARFGAAYYNKYIVEKIQGMNYVHLLEIFVIALPILFHLLYGCVIWWYGKSNLGNFGYFRNWMWWVQRISGFGIAAFLTMHVGWTRIWSIWNEQIAHDMYSHMRVLLSNPITLTAYILGLVLAILHLTNGLWTFGITWGITTTPKAQKVSMAILGAVFLALLFFGLHGLSGFFFTTNPPPGSIQ